MNYSLFLKCFKYFYLFASLAFLIGYVLLIGATHMGHDEYYLRSEPGRSLYGYMVCNATGQIMISYEERSSCYDNERKKWIAVDDWRFGGYEVCKASLEKISDDKGREECLENALATGIKIYDPAVDYYSGKLEDAKAIWSIGMPLYFFIFLVFDILLAFSRPRGLLYSGIVLVHCGTIVVWCFYGLETLRAGLS
ncbi:MAG: hypothetical protein JWM96_1341 [Alphaproteobacteria bacterium]|nr:hypothetical protein [Alphaproteobacteria bacterium]